MHHEWLKRVYDLPAIFQGALGSAVFWTLLQVFQFLGRALLHLLGRTTATLEDKRKIREYIYRRYTSRSGYINYAYGTMFGLGRAFRGLLAGFIFCSVALLVGGNSPVIWSMCFAAAIFYFVSALTWLVPSSNWRTNDQHEHWKRVAELEKELFGEVDKQTLEYLGRFAAPGKHRMTR